MQKAAETHPEDQRLALHDGKTEHKKTKREMERRTEEEEERKR